MNRHSATDALVLLLFYLDFRLDRDVLFPEQFQRLFNAA